MDKRYQFFISSTFTDLQTERQAVLKALLELDQMPAGMELFPAADSTAWDLIRGVIDSSDFYILVVGGRYGSMDADGLSFTEKEYDYARRQKKPVFALLHRDPNSIPREKTESSEAAWTKLEAFRTKVEKHHTCNYWVSAEELKAQVMLAVLKELKKTKAVGWVRADQVPSGATIQDVLRLRNRVAELEAQIADTSLRPPEGTEDLQQGDEVYSFHVGLSVWKDGRRKYRIEISMSWDQIFAAVAPKMINEASNALLKNALKKAIEDQGEAVVAGEQTFKATPREWEVRDDDIETCILQMRALGLITESKQRRAVKDTQTYWTLTPYGDQRMMQLRAIRSGTRNTDAALAETLSSDVGTTT